MVEQSSKEGCPPVLFSGIVLCNNDSCVYHRPKTAFGVRCTIYNAPVNGDEDLQNGERVLQD
jgi:hypothetical protein